MELGYKIVIGGFDNYLIFVDFCFKGIDGGRVEKVLEVCFIVCNKNICLGDRSVLWFSGLWLGILVLMFCGFLEKDF